MSDRDIYKAITRMVRANRNAKGVEPFSFEAIKACRVQYSNPFKSLTDRRAHDRADLARRFADYTVAERLEHWTSHKAGYVSLYDWMIGYDC